MSAPFDTARLDRLMHDAGMDILLATSKHSVQYFLGGHRAAFFDYMDAIGVSRYLPVFIYPRGAPDQAGYVGHRLETHQHQAAPFWIKGVDTTSSGSVDAMEKAIAYIRKQGLPASAIGIESAFLPLDSARALTSLLPEAKQIDALYVLERLRLRKSPAELELVRQATEKVNDAMAETFAAVHPGMTKRDVVQTLREAETRRGLVFEYCLIAAGTSHNRAASDQVLQHGDVINLDSGANYHGYLGDIARMGVVGDPDPELEYLLAQIEGVQRAAFAAIRPGAPGGDIYAAANDAVRATGLGNQLHFLAHGMGLVSHEAPHLTAEGPVPYPDDDARLPLEPGTVLSVETTLNHSTRGFIKLEDTVAVTPHGSELFGDSRRGWTRTGTNPA